MNESTATYRWREKTRVVVVDQVMMMQSFALAVFFSLAIGAWVVAYKPAPPTARAVAAMVREDAREMVEVLQRAGVWTMVIENDDTPNGIAFIDGDVTFYGYDADISTTAPPEFIIEYRDNALDGVTLCAVDGAGVLSGTRCDLTIGEWMLMMAPQIVEGVR